MPACPIAIGTLVWTWGRLGPKLKIRAVELGKSLFIPMGSDAFNIERDMTSWGEPRQDLDLDTRLKIVTYYIDRVHLKVEIKGTVTKWFSHQPFQINSR